MPPAGGNGGIGQVAAKIGTPAKRENAEGGRSGKAGLGLSSGSRRTSVESSGREREVKKSGIRMGGFGSPRMRIALNFLMPVSRLSMARPCFGPAFGVAERLGFFPSVSRLSMARPCFGPAFEVAERLRFFSSVFRLSMARPCFGLAFEVAERLRFFSSVSRLSMARPCFGPAFGVAERLRFLSSVSRLSMACPCFGPAFGSAFGPVFGIMERRLIFPPVCGLLRAAVSCASVWRGALLRRIRPP